VFLIGLCLTFCMSGLLWSDDASRIIKIVSICMPTFPKPQLYPNSGSFLQFCNASHSPKTLGGGVEQGAMGIISECVQLVLHSPLKIAWAQIRSFSSSTPLNTTHVFDATKTNDVGMPLHNLKAALRRKHIPNILENMSLSVVSVKNPLM
jgi:hypothetical protein